MRRTLRALLTKHIDRSAGMLCFPGDGLQASLWSRVYHRVHSRDPLAIPPLALFNPSFLGLRQLLGFAVDHFACN
jgi:hypothetical protein